MYDADMVNTINNERYAEYLWEREKKNQILSMSNPQKKQAQWNKLFPKFISNSNQVW